MASSAADTDSQSEVADVTVLDAKGLPTRCVENLKLSMPRRFLVSITSGETTKRTAAVPHSEGAAEWKQVLAGFNLKAQDAVPLLASGQQSTSPASAMPYEPGSTDNRPAQNPAQLSTSGLPVIETAPEENTTNISSTADVSNTDPPPLASAIVDAADFVNAVNTQVGSWTTLLDNINYVAQILDKISQTIAQQIERDANVRGLVDDLDKGFKTLREAKDLEERCSDSTQAEILSRIFQQTSECGFFIDRYFKNSSFSKRLLSNLVSGPEQIVKQYRTALADLRNEFLERTTITTKICVLQITDRLERGFEQLSDKISDTLLSKLPYGGGARFNPKQRCQPETRSLFLGEIESWIKDPESAQVLVLFGEAGTGKSTIASEIAQRFHDQLTSSFVFDRSFSHPPHHVITRLTRDLCKVNLPFKRSLVEVLQADPSLVDDVHCAMLFQRLLVEQLEKFDFIGNYLIIIDALDECKDNKERKSLVTVLSEDVRKLPGNFRILLTARPEKDLGLAFGRVSSNSDACVRIMHMNEERFKADTEHDILEYTRSRLRIIPLQDSDCQQVARLAGTLFQWASVACDFIVNPPSGLVRADCLKQVLSNEMHDAQNQLDELYHWATF
ncbi:hypothetical protein K488DRAFT_91286 [Vararia minispora EC-137]|uniref:Uncharacterized protein n=1 Tax=Vararia minispora EC-137 TaxID=1314806 RepID=A0ACB8Q663_9AGAM|nr:hypothetical protein K488DRAFT_91286 [Vararia minispora EC-137]